MTAKQIVLVGLLAAGACSKGGGATGAAASGSGSGSGAAKGGKGFSAALSADLAKETPGAGSGTAASSGAAAETKTATAGTAGSAAAATKTATAAGTAAGPGGAATGQGSAAEAHVRGPTKVAPELAAIKFDLEPNWDRDYDGPGTFGFVLRVPNTSETHLFYFHYGYDDPKAPSDCEEYKTWVGDAKSMTVTLERQRGAACYLEGTDAAGTPVFVYHLLYGGKHLICYGLLYKDTASNRLGDLRDKVLMQAKKICETITL